MGKENKSGRIPAVETVLYEHRPHHAEAGKDHEGGANYWHPVFSIAVDHPNHDDLLQAKKTERLTAALQAGSGFPTFDVVLGQGR